MDRIRGVHPPFAYCNFLLSNQIKGKKACKNQYTKTFTHNQLVYSVCRNMEQQHTQTRRLQAEQGKVHTDFLNYTGFFIGSLYYNVIFAVFHFGLLAGLCWWTLWWGKGLELFISFLFRFICLRNWVPPPHKHISCSRKWWISSRWWQRFRLISVRPWRTNTSTVLRSAFWRNKWKVIPKFHSGFKGGLLLQDVI